MRSARLEYRIAEPDDAAALAALMNDAEVRRFLDRRVFPIGVESERRWVERMQKNAEERADLVLVFGVAGRDHIAGVTGLHHLDWINRSTEWGIALRPDAWGHGYGAEAARQILAHAFLHLNLNAVRLRVNRTHERAIRCYEKVGFVEEGVMRQAAFVEGVYQDVLMMSVLREEWEKQGRE